MARPKKEIDPIAVEKLAAINCSVAEIGAVLDCDRRTLQRRFAAAIEKGREVGKSSLKRKMWEHAMGGNTTMMIWLSKQMLGYSDKVEQTNLGDDQVKKIKIYLPANKKTTEENNTDNN